MYIDKEIRFAFSKATNGNDEQGQIKLTEAIHQECPDLIESKEPTWAKFGFWSHVAFIGDYVVKAPKFKGYVYQKEFEEECLYLEKLKNIDLAPNVIHIGKNYNFCVMQRMPGILLTKSNIKIIPEHKERIVKTLIKFSHDLSKALPEKNYPKEKIIDKEFILSEVHDIEQEFTTPYFQKTLGEARYKEYTNLMKTMKQFYIQHEPVMCHADLKDDNIMVNKKDPGEVTGVIDFGDVRKCVSPETFFGLTSLGFEFQTLFQKYYSPHTTIKQIFNIPAASKALQKMWGLTQTPDNITDTQLSTADNLVAQCKIPSI